MDFNNVEKYLRNGGDPKVIAQEFADKINEVISKMNQENDIIEAAENVTEAWADFLDAYFIVHKLPTGFHIEDFDVTKEEIVKIIETLVTIAPYFEKYVSTLEKISDSVETIKNNSKKIDPSFEGTITKFFNKMNI